MKLIIDISNDDYEFVKEQVDTEYCNDVRQINNRLYQIIANGTVLPKGHGRLIDADKIEYFESSFLPLIYSDIVVRKEFIDAMPTILDADKEIKNESNN